MKKAINDLPDEQYTGKRVMVRADLNVPMAEGRIREDFRLRRSVATIEHLCRRGARLIVLSHLGRPKGKPIPEWSLRPVADHLSRILKVQTFRFSEEVMGESVRNAIEGLKAGEVLLLENIRFHPGEESNDPAFSKELASLADIYVNDAFGTLHRAHASVYGAAKLFPLRLAGFLVKKELEMLSQIRDCPVRPLTVVVGGIKIKDKLSALNTLIPKADHILLGGGIAYTFLSALGKEVGHSPVEKDQIPWAKRMLEQYGERIRLPMDHVIAMGLKERQGFQMIHGNIPEGFLGLDIGRETSLQYTHEIMKGEGTIFWSGPLGAFEFDEFADGTVDIARAIALAHWRGAVTVVGGGDTVSALRRAEVLETEVSHISTGGGASLRYIGGEELPGIAVLTDSS